MPLFADQFINAKRAQQFGTAQILDKLKITPQAIEKKIRTILENNQ